MTFAARTTSAYSTENPTKKTPSPFHLSTTQTRIPPRKGQNVIIKDMYAQLQDFNHPSCNKQRAQASTLEQISAPRQNWIHRKPTTDRKNNLGYRMRDRRNETEHRDLSVARSVLNCSVSSIQLCQKTLTSLPVTSQPLHLATLVRLADRKKCIRKVESMQDHVHYTSQRRSCVNRSLERTLMRALDACTDVDRPRLTRHICLFRFGMRALLQSLSPHPQSLSL